MYMKKKESGRKQAGTGSSTHVTMSHAQPRGRGIQVLLLLVKAVGNVGEKEEKQSMLFFFLSFHAKEEPSMCKSLEPQTEKQACHHHVRKVEVVCCCPASHTTERYTQSGFPGERRIVPEFMFFTMHTCLSRVHCHAMCKYRHKSAAMLPASPPRPCHTVCLVLLCMPRDTEATQACCQNVSRCPTGHKQQPGLPRLRCQLKEV